MLEISTSLLALIGILAGAAVAWQAVRADRVDRQLSERVQDAQKKTEENPDKAAPAWELAQATLDKYFNRNLNQIKWIFFVAVFVMLGGFGVILYGVALAMRPNGVEPSRIAALSGIVTESIGATFIWVYRSTMRQASGFMKILDRINTVGMAIQILDSMPGGGVEGSLKNTTRAHLVALLMTPDAHERITEGTTKTSKSRRRRKGVDKEE
jgi:phage shock protein PspC (stress-responsive transcriptional regulator)